MCSYQPGKKKAPNKSIVEQMKLRQKHKRELKVSPLYNSYVYYHVFVGCYKRNTERYKVFGTTEAKRAAGQVN